MATQGQINAQTVSAYVGQPIVNFANQFFPNIPDPAQRIAEATRVIRGFGYNVGRGLIYVPTPAKPDVQIKTTRDGKSQFLQVKGKTTLKPRARAGISFMIFPSKYGPEFTVSALAYGTSQSNKGIRVTVPRKDIMFTPEGAMEVKLKVYPDKDLILQAQSWIQNAPVGQPTPAGVPSTPQPQTQRPTCFGMYMATERECQICADAGPCAQKAQQPAGGT